MISARQVFFPGLPSLPAFKIVSGISPFLNKNINAGYSKLIFWQKISCKTGIVLLFNSIPHFGKQLSIQLRDGPTCLKSMKPRSTLTAVSRTCMRSPTSRPATSRTTFPSTGMARSLAHVHLSEAPVTMASNCSPMLDCSRRAAAALSTCRSILSAVSSSSVQCLARASSSSLP